MEKNSTPKELKKRTGIIGVALTIFCVLIVLSVIIASLDGFRETFVGGPSLALGFTGSPVAILIFAIVFFRHRSKILRTTILMAGFVISIYLLGCVGIALGGWLLNTIFMQVGTLFVAISLSLGIVISITSFKSKSLAIFLSLLLIMIAPITLNFTLSYIYTPPALTSDNLTVYNQCLDLLKSHSEYEHFRLTKVYWYFLDRDRNMISGNKAINYLPIEDIIKIGELQDRLYKVKCYQVRREKDFVLFYKDDNYILPVGPGVVYSLSGKDPNDVEDDVFEDDIFNGAKPFIRITGDWYMSRGLMLGGYRTDIPGVIPKSLIDHSLRIEGLDLSVGVQGRI